MHFHTNTASCSLLLTTIKNSQVFAKHRSICMLVWLRAGGDCVSLLPPPGAHEGCDVSSVGVGAGRRLPARADDERAAGPRDRQGVQQHPPDTPAAGRGHAGLLQAPGLLRVHRDCWGGRESVSVLWSHDWSQCQRSRRSKSAECREYGHLLLIALWFGFVLLRHTWNTFGGDSAVNSYFVSDIWHVVSLE